MKTSFKSLEQLLLNANITDSNGNNIWADVHGLLIELGGELDVIEKRIECAVRSAREINKLVSKYTEDVDNHRPINMSVNDHDFIQNRTNDIDIALDFDDDMCVTDNWYNLFSPKEEPKPITVGNIEYDFPEDVYTIGNSDNSEIIGDVYESDFIRLCELGLIWCESDKQFPVGGYKANYVVRNNEFTVIVKAKQIDLSKVPIKSKIDVGDNKIKKTQEEIQNRMNDDRAFIVSAVTSELHNTAYLQYFETWENNGGMGWFFDTCVEIVDEIMFTEGSAYLKWLEHWKVSDIHCNTFSEVTNETCFDWYHMNEARSIFESRYKKDVSCKEQIMEHVEGIMGSLSVDEKNDILEKLNNLVIK